MIKLISGLFKMMVNIVLVSLISVYVTWAVVGLYIDKLTKQYNLNSNISKPSFSEIVKTFSDYANILDVTPSNQPNDLDHSITTPIDKAAPTLPSNLENALPVISQSTEASKQLEGNERRKDQLVMSLEDFSNKKEKMGQGDKMMVFTLLANRIPERELQQLTSYIENGINLEEMSKIEEIIHKYLKPQEVDQLLSIINRY
jgi:hypothetical protein